MMFSMTDLRSLTLAAQDGDIGAIADFYIDDATWMICYVVADTGSWLPGRQVLLAPKAFDAPDLAAGRINVKLTREQIRSSPPADLKRPISRAVEAEIHRHFGWTPYWGDPRGGVDPGAAPAGRTLAAAVAAAEDTHLRSARAIASYAVAARDGDIGQVKDVLLDPAPWMVRYMVVDTGSWWTGREVLVSPQWIDDVSWSEQRVRLDLTREQVRSSPPFDRDESLSREYEERLFAFYDRVPYWE